MDVTSHNVGLPALEVRNSECSGTLLKCGRTTKTWQKRYCILRDACIYYYKNMYSPRAQGNCRKYLLL
jgi:tripartite motif-containing protein 2/3